MNTETLKFILIIFSVYASMQITKDMNIADNWFNREPVRYLISFVVAVVVSILLNKIYKKRIKRNSRLL